MDSEKNDAPVQSYRTRRPLIGITCSRVTGGAWGIYALGHFMDYLGTWGHLAPGVGPRHPADF